MRTASIFGPLVLLAAGAASGFAADADVTFVEARRTGDELWRFDVTIESEETGWDKYADGWNVVLPDGTVARADDTDEFTRELLHPHENEQPFTRSRRNVPIPSDVSQVTVRAHDSAEGWGGREVTVDLNRESGEDFRVRE
ncbi:MAG: hypothetical protein ACLFM0_00315 [Spirochaetales bacterium]